MARKRYLKDARKRARQAGLRKARHGQIIQRAQQGAYVQPSETTYLLNQLNQFGQPGYTLRYGDNMTANDAVELAAQGARRMDQIDPTRRGSLMQPAQPAQPVQPAVPQQTAMPQPQQPQLSAPQGGLAGGIQPPVQSGYGFGPDPNMQANDDIIAAGKQASGVANMEAAAPKIDASQVAETVTPELAGAGAEVAGDAAGAAAGGGGGVSAGAVGAAGAVLDAGGKALQENADDTTGKNVAGTTVSGVGKGAAMGASIGTMIAPGIGTAIGAGVGALAGGVAGFVKGKKTQNKAIGDRRKTERRKAEELINMRSNATTTVGRNIGANVGASTAGSNSYLANRNASGYAKYGSFMKYYDGGMKQLPGGVQMPIGYGVDKFVGNKHDQSGMGSPSGIILEEGGKSKPGIEVEDGELQTKVKTTKGKKEYIVSDHIVNPATGNTLAEDMEREIKKAKSKKEADKIKQKYVKLNEQLKDDGKPEIVKAQRGKFRGVSRKDRKQYEADMAQYEKDQAAYEEQLAENERKRAEMEAENERRAAANEAEQARFEQETADRDRILAENEAAREAAAGRGAVQEKDESGQRIYGGDESANIANFLRDREAEYGRLPEEFQTYDFDQFKDDAGQFDASKFDTQARSGFRDYYNALPDDLVTGKIATDNDTSDLIFGQQWNTRKFLERPGAPDPVREQQMLEMQEVDAEAPVKPEMPGAPEAPPGKLRMRNPGTMLQALGPAYALTQNFSPETIATPYEKERILGRVNLNQERARAAAATEGANRAIQTSVAGPAAIAAQQANLARAQSAQANISDREGKQNVQIANQETGINVGVAARNARNFANTQRFNAQMRKKAADQNIENRIAAVNQLGRIGTQTVKDRNQMRADIFQGQASQVDGEFDRALQNYYRGSRIGPPGSRININPEGGTTMSQEQIDALYAGQADQAEETPTARRGRYTRKPGRVNRRKKRRRR